MMKRWLHLMQHVPCDDSSRISGQFSLHHSLETDPYATLGADAACTVDDKIAGAYLMSGFTANGNSL